MGERRAGGDFFSIGLGIQRPATVVRMGERRTGCDFYSILGIQRWSATVAQINGGLVLAMSQTGNGMIVLDNSKL